jgi:D-3-phosphoglycerate dehydrogenase / 2-oxoglutarate reductase
MPDYCTDEVADHTAALALASLRKLKVLDSSVRAEEWDAVKHCKPMKPFKETIYGFFGFGQIGRAVHLRLRGFGFRFMASDPALPKSQAAVSKLQQLVADDIRRALAGQPPRCPVPLP